MRQQIGSQCGGAVAAGRIEQRTTAHQEVERHQRECHGAEPV